MQHPPANPVHTSKPNSMSSPVLHYIVLIFFIVLTCGLAVSTYSVLSATWDEPEHLAAGIALIDKGQYPYDAQHPPLARLAMAIGPYLAGARSHGRSGPSGEQEGRDILYSNGKYDTYLSLARAGMLPFLVLLMIATWLWAQRYFGISVATVATLFVATTPTLIGHAAVGALDMPVSAMIILALYLFLRWHEQPTVKRASLFGIVAGLAVATKLSAVPFIGCTIIVWLIAAQWTPSRTSPVSQPTLRIARYAQHGSVALLLAFVALITCYGLRWEAWPAQYPLHLPVGVHRFINSLIELNEHNSSGHASYLFGKVSHDGWWNFYLVVMGVKTPLPLLVLGLIGMGWTLRQGWRDRNWVIAAPAIAVLAILLFSSAYSNINIGVRHVLVLFPLLAILAAVTVTTCWQRWPSPLARGMVMIILCWQASSLLRAHPDHLAYFNELAGTTPERIVVDSDLDWGQDVRRLSLELARRQVKDVSVLYRGTADLTEEHFPAAWRNLQPGKPTHGWVAVSLYAKQIAKQRQDYAWLEQYQPVMRVGKSFDLYFIPPTTDPAMTP